MPPHCAFHYSYVRLSVKYDFRKKAEFFFDRLQIAMGMIWARMSYPLRYIT